MPVLTAVVTTVDLPGGDPPAQRVRVELWRNGSRLPFLDEHLRVELPAPGPWPWLADVLLVRGTATGPAHRYPGTLVVAAYRGRRCRLRIGPGLPVLALRAAGSTAEPPWSAVASAAHAWLVAGQLSSRARTASASGDPERPAAR